MSIESWKARWDYTYKVTCPDCGRGARERCKRLAKKPQDATGRSIPVGSDREVPHPSRIYLGKARRATSNHHIFDTPTTLHTTS